MGSVTGKKAPKAPSVAELQKAGQVNQNTPFGTTAFSTGADGRTTASYNPSAEFAGLAPALGNFASKNLNSGFSFQDTVDRLNAGGANSQSLRAGLTDLGNPEDLVSGLGNFGSINPDFAAASKQAQDATYQGSMNLLQPQLDLQRRRTEQRLADQGLPISGEAYNGEMNRLDTAQGQQLNNLALASVLAGNDRQNQLFGQESTIADLADRQRQQQFAENQGVFNAQAQNRGQQFGENQAVFDSVLRKQMALAGLSNQNAAMAQQLLQPMNIPGAVTDSNAVQQNYQNKLAANQQKQDAWGGLLQTGATLGAAALMSDRRLKENIDHIGYKNGFPVYEFSYKGQDGRFVGVMAQDVEKIAPEAVTEINGYKAVYYNVINVPFERVA